jgi:hypothetical protein
LAYTGHEAWPAQPVGRLIAQNITQNNTLKKRSVVFTMFLLPLNECFAKYPFI